MSLIKVPVVTPERILADERAKMECTPLQGQLALGKEEWARVEALLVDPNTDWAMAQVIKAAQVWKRNSQMIDELGWLMGYSDTQIDELFRKAMKITV